MTSTPDVPNLLMISRLFPTILNLPDFDVFSSFIVKDVLWDVCEINSVAYEIRLWFLLQSTVFGIIYQKTQVKHELKIDMSSVVLSVTYPFRASGNLGSENSHLLQCQSHPVWSYSAFPVLSTIPEGFGQGNITCIGSSTKTFSKFTKSDWFLTK